MQETVIIDGNNLLHAVRMLGPTLGTGREKLLKDIERWATAHRRNVILAFDGHAPHGPFARQMMSQVLEVVFSGKRTADDCIVERIRQAPHPDRLTIVSDDTAIVHEARGRRCRVLANALFIASLYPPDETAPKDRTSVPPFEKPKSVSQNERDFWLESFDDGEPDEPFDGFDAMNH